ncbi:TIMELESS-interacting protein [Xylocopa sonorina]|uniref:TIMELESS-interacting protein n=1 Tax=Xylocopa sonorina TaxID=1818115 RepID=UPI00403B0CCA
MSTLCNSDYEDDDDIVAEYEKQESDGNQGNVDKNEGFDSENEESKEEENTARRVDPSSSKRHVVRNPLPKLNTERLKGPKGIHTIEKYFEGFKFHGQGYEKYDLDKIMKRLEHWGHRLFPKLDFDDFLEKLEKLGTKKDLQVFIKKYRQDMINEDNDIINQDNMDAEEDKEQYEPIDEFDLLIAEQIEKQKQVMQHTSPNVSATNNHAFDNLLSQSNVKTSQCSATTTTSQLTDEVKKRIERNRQQAIQRRLARLKEQDEEIKRKKSEDVEYTNAENN